MCNRVSETRRDDLAEAIGRSHVPHPAIAVIMPVFKAQVNLLEAAVQSLQDQVFEQWELCICDDGSNDSALAAVLERIAEQDPRVRLTSLPANAGISAATNAAAALASAPILLLLDQDDLLSPDCLGEFFLAFASDEAVDLAYSDNDKIDLANHRHGPSFKPGWSPTLLLSYMFAGHAIAVKTALFRDLGGMRSEFDGSQDYDFMLRASERARRVAHLPGMFYHWRVMPGSTALSAKEKPGSIIAGQRAISEALDRRGVAATIEWPDWAQRAGIGLFSPRFKQPLLPHCVIVHGLEGATPDETMLCRLSDGLPPGSRVILATGSGDTFGHRVTAAMQQAQGMPLLLVNADARLVQADSLGQLFGYMNAAGAGAAGGRVIGADGRLINAGFVRPNGSEKAEPAFAGLARHRPGYLYLARVARECFAVSADCLAVARELTGLLGPVPADVHDSDTLGLWISEQARAAGQSVLCCPDAEVEVRQTRGAGKLPRAHGDDRWYNRNLGMCDTQFRPARRTVPLRADRPLRVAAVSHNLDREGAQTLLVDLLCQLKAEGAIDPVVISPKGGELEATLAEAGIPVWKIEAAGRRMSAKRLNERVASLAEAYGRAGADVVLANTLEMYAAVEAAEIAGLGALWWQHEGGAWHDYFKPLRSHAQARAFAAFNIAYRVIQVAEFTRQAWLPIALRDNFELVRHGISPRPLHDAMQEWSRESARAELGLEPGDLCIVLMGSISAHKGQLDIIQALGLIDSATAPKLRIVIAGAIVEPGYGEKMAAAIAGLPPAKQALIDLVGRVSDTSLYYSAADVLVCCSRQESAPLAIVEAMQFGVPVVTTPVDGIPELVEFGGNSLAYNPGDVAALAGILSNLASSIDCIPRLRTRSLELAQHANNRKYMIGRFAQLLREGAMMRGNRPSVPLG
ncbi:glycosyltransferase [Novosphingobium sp. MMS21-SN21R]|uniref:glycosyltransferase n=1 Tax=Novosphingobium sp. MMS21-SN21R TaxID=2969298 RepID=UPI0028857D3B|nr:glycosyltransferase [Novosphingobium sp. MMS21-SN21R]MDT0507087.1 glycosyltransferase [Novosphingobium sp. MMS21-SN21R]